MRCINLKNFTPQVFAEHVESVFQLFVVHRLRQTMDSHKFGLCEILNSTDLFRKENMRLNNKQTNKTLFHKINFTYLATSFSIYYGYTTHFVQ